MFFMPPPRVFKGALRNCLPPFPINRRKPVPILLPRLPKRPPLAQLRNLPACLTILAAIFHAFFIAPIAFSNIFCPTNFHTTNPLIKVLRAPVNLSNHSTACSPKVSPIQFLAAS